MKMSDALRNAAETAAVDTAHVSVSAARARVRRARALRGSANAVAGVGAAALVFAGVMGVVSNQSALLTAGDAGVEDDAAAPNVGSADGPAAMPGFDGGANVCGSKFDSSAFVVDPATAAISVDGVEDGVLKASIATTAAVDGEFTTGHPTTYVLWDGIIVGSAPVTLEAWTWTSVAGETTTQPLTVALVNCWDDSALPAGDYAIVSAQQLSAIQGAAEDGASDQGTLDTTIVSEAAPFTVPGEPEDDPFAKYLIVDKELPAQPTPAGPSNALSVDQARAAYEAGLTRATWDMAAGTQRVVMTSASDGGDLWQKNYFGCPMEGANSSFPGRSATVDWLQVDAQLPGSVHLSYGWVVDGNPVVSYSVKNVTNWSLPGFYGASAPRLVLVKDGKVVAEAYPVDPTQNGGAIAYASIGVGVNSSETPPRDSMLWAPNTNGYLSPGASMSGDYLWRDLNGCWNAKGQTRVGAGTYTVLSAQDIYVGEQYAMYAEGRDEGAADAAEGSGDGTDSAVAPVAPPAPDFAPDWASFQVWTSLGTVSITN